MNQSLLLLVLADAPGRRRTLPDATNGIPDTADRLDAAADRPEAANGPPDATDRRRTPQAPADAAATPPDAAATN